MGKISDYVEGKTKYVYSGAYLSFFLQRWTERIGLQCVPDDPAQKKAVYSGAYRSGEDNGRCISGCKSSGGRTGGEDFLSYCENDHADSRKMCIRDRWQERCPWYLSADRGRLTEEFL